MKKVLLYCVLLIICLGSDCQIMNSENLYGDHSDSWSITKKENHELLVKGYFSSTSMSPESYFESIIKGKWNAYHKQIDRGETVKKFTDDDLMEILVKAPFDKEGNFSISEVVNVGGMKKELIYKKALQYLTNEVVLSKNDNNCVFACNGTVNEKYRNCNLQYTLKVQCKDNKYRIEICNMVEKKSYDMDEFNKNDEPIETYMKPDHYDQVSNNSRILFFIKKSCSSYINNRLIVLISHLNQMYNIRDTIKSYIVQNQQKTDSNW